jgi:hypothetical protein
MRWSSWPRPEWTYSRSTSVPKPSSSRSSTLADFFTFDPGSAPVEVIYERAFLCALPRKLWTRYAERMADLLAPQQRLAGFFFYSDNLKGPPFGTSPQELLDLLDAAFERIEDRPTAEPLPVFQDGERWQVWRRR